MAMVLAALAVFVAIPAPACSMGLEESLSRLAFAPYAPRSTASIPGRRATPTTCSLSPPSEVAVYFPGSFSLPRSSHASAFLPPPRLEAAHAPAPRTTPVGLLALRAAGSMGIEPAEGERDYRTADLKGTRLFVTGLPATVPPPPPLKPGAVSREDSLGLGV